MKRGFWVALVLVALGCNSNRDSGTKTPSVDDLRERYKTALEIRQMELRRRDEIGDLSRRIISQKDSTKKDLDEAEAMEERQMKRVDRANADLTAAEKALNDARDKTP